jgi:hypothetical protein
VTLSDEQTETFRRLEHKLRTSQRALKRLDAYYELQQRIQQLGLAVPPELEGFLTIANWPRITADSLEERIDLEGFRLPGQEEADAEMWDKIWQPNDLDEESQLAHLEALVLARSFVCVGSGGHGPESDEERTPERDPAVPLITVESPFEMAAELDPRTRRVRAAGKVYKDDDQQEWATLYLPNSTHWLARDRVRGRWVEQDRDEHRLNSCPVEPIVNRPRTRNRLGVSEIVDVIPFTDAAARALTNAQLATETLAVPQRYVLGATKGDFVDKDGNVLDAWQAYFGAVWALRNEGAKVGQFSAADLGNFKTIVEHYATLVSGVTGLPMRYLGQNLSNPPSAEGIRADEARLIKRAERRHRAWGGSWERVMRLARRIIDGDWDPKLKSMETLWRDPATPTKAQQADAVVKLTQGENPILPIEAAWEEMGFGPTKRAKLKEQFAAERAAKRDDALLAGLLRDVTSLPEAPEPAPAVTGAAGG